MKKGIKYNRAWGEEFLSDLEARALSSNTVETYRRYLGLFLDFADSRGLRLGDVNILDIRSFLATLVESKSKSSRALIITIVRSFFRFCFKRGYIRIDPAAVVCVPKFDAPLPNFLTEGEALLFCQMPVLVLRDKAILEVLYASGVRVHELTGINVEDVDLKSRVIRVRGKGRKERLVLYGRRAAEALKYYLIFRRFLQSGGIKWNALFLNYIGRRMSDRQVQRVVHKYLVFSGLSKKVSPHTFRHSFASHLMSRGCGITEISELLGHESLATTEKYCHTDLAFLMKNYRKAFAHNSST